MFIQVDLCFPFFNHPVTSLQWDTCLEIRVLSLLRCTTPVLLGNNVHICNHSCSLLLDSYFVFMMYFQSWKLPNYVKVENDFNLDVEAKVVCLEYQKTYPECEKSHIWTHLLTLLANCAGQNTLYDKLTLYNVTKGTYMSQINDINVPPISLVLKFRSKYVTTSNCF